MECYTIIAPQTEPVPVLLSVPHCGTIFPDELRNDFKQHLIDTPDDTDWYVHQLYDFATELGITLIHANYSRWVIDLNRDPQSKPLYTDGRIITGLCPVTTFSGEPIYNDERTEVIQHEVTRRIQRYYIPYHNKLQELINQFKERFGTVLLWDCHSIRHHVPTIHQEKFPDLILGDADGTSASPGLIETAILNLESAGYSFQHNYPFKGGYITRHYGAPSDNQHALQLEMSKLIYMDGAEKLYDAERAAQIRKLLRHTLGELTEKLQESQS